MAKIINRIISYILLGFIRLYQFTLSPFIGGQCRFYPTCSCYAQQAIKTHGPYYGSWLTLKRLVKCHPWGGCGVDEVPKKK